MAATVTFSPASSALVTPLSPIGITWTDAAWPLDRFIITIDGKTAYSKIGDHTAQGADFFLGGWSGTHSYDAALNLHTFSVVKDGGYGYSDSIDVSFYHKLAGLSAITDTASFISALPGGSYNPDHATEAVGLLLEQFKEATNLQNLLLSYITQVQDLEDKTYPLLAVRDVNVATGDRLDGLGEIVGEERKGRSDEIYRVYILVRLAVNKSNGTAAELINILQLISRQATPDIWYDEYQPKTAYIRARNWAPSDPPSLIAGLLRQAKPAGTNLVFIYAEDADDTNLFTWDIGPGLDQGKLAGDA